MELARAVTDGGGLERLVHRLRLSAGGWRARLAELARREHDRAIGAWSDARRIRRRVPELAASWLSHRGSADVRRAHARYVAEVSSPTMAISEPSCQFLWCLCHAARPTSILDLGSGLSSYVFRRYAADSTPPCLVASVDQDERWLERTRRFCEAEGVGTGPFLPWDEFLHQSRPGCDLLFYDLTESMGARADHLDRLELVVKPGALAVFDDAHVHAFYTRLREWLAARRWETFPLRCYTRDRFGRYMVLARRPAASLEGRP